MTSLPSSVDFLIIGGGMVGLSLAHQILHTYGKVKIALLEKEDYFGAHSSGRNSGVLHAGLYYKPGSLKAKVCVAGAKRLKEWIISRKLPINECGKVVVPTSPNLDSQLDVLESRGRQNGAVVNFIDTSQLQELFPSAKSASGRALWSPNTSVVKPKIVIRQLSKELSERSVQFYLGQTNWTIDTASKCVTLNDGSRLHYGHLFNCAGLQADRIARKFDLGHEYRILPFKGLYWQLRINSPIKVPTNLYPVPDLNVPFLGVHFTPSADSNPVVTIGPTATFCPGRENYSGFSSIEPFMALNNLTLLARQYFLNKGGFRRYVHEQSILSFKPFLIQSAKALIPSLESSHIQLSEKVGIRAQLFNIETQVLEDDFICVHAESSTHVLNAISPAFTASFALADLILSSNKKL